MRPRQQTCPSTRNGLKRIRNLPEEKARTTRRVLDGKKEEMIHSQLDWFRLFPEKDATRMISPAVAAVASVPFSFATALAPALARVAHWLGHLPRRLLWLDPT